MTHFWGGPDLQGCQSSGPGPQEQIRYGWATEAISSAVASALTTDELLRIALELTIAAGQGLSRRVQVERAQVEPDADGLKRVLESREPVAFSERLAEPSRYIS